VHFVYILGADSFANFHRWRAWREIASLVPIAVVDRPRWTLRALRGKAAATLDGRKVAAAALLASEPPAWTFVTGPRSNLSSTDLRDKLLKSLDRR
jgi:nicotinate-nucleotide adenylyltransferase